MVVQGTFIAFIGDWFHATRLCVCIPSKGVLLISEPIADPMVPQFDNSAAYRIDLHVQQQLIIDGVSKKLDEGDYPWATPTETHLLDVMAGATLIGLHLACKGSGLKYPDDLFQDILYKEPMAMVKETEQSWKDVRARHAAKKKQAIHILKAKRQANKLSTVQEGGGSSRDPELSMGKGVCLVLSLISCPMLRE